MCVNTCVYMYINIERENMKLFQDNYLKVNIALM